MVRHTPLTWIKSDPSINLRLGRTPYGVRELKLNKNSPLAFPLLAQEGFLFFQPATIVSRDMIQTEHEVNT